MVLLKNSASVGPRVSPTKMAQMFYFMGFLHSTQTGKAPYLRKGTRHSSPTNHASSFDDLFLTKKDTKLRLVASLDLRLYEKKPSGHSTGKLLGSLPIDFPPLLVPIPYQAWAPCNRSGTRRTARGSPPSRACEPASVWSQKWVICCWNLKQEKQTSSLKQRGGFKGFSSI